MRRQRWIILGDIPHDRAGIPAVDEISYWI